MKKIVLCTSLLLSVWFGIGFGRKLSQQVILSVAEAAPTAKESGSSKADRYEHLELFQKVLHFVENNYVDPDKAKTKLLVEGAIKGMLESLDPHSNFLSPEILKDMKVDTSGKFGGLGIEIGERDKVLTIIAPMEDTPAWKAGLKPDDRIVKIDKEPTRGTSLVEAVNKMRGKPGTPVTLTIYREGFKDLKDVTIVRDIIKIQSVKFEALADGFGYVRLSNFNERAALDIDAAIEKLEKTQKDKKLKGLILDLRLNPGGLLDQAVDVASLFIEDSVVVSTIGRNPDQKEVKYAKRGKARKDLPVAVLVSSSTASAAEIVAGALQDHHRALILGQTTFGKGSVQSVIDLGPDIGLKLTVARYYTPSGRSIQEKGVVPDIVLEDYDPVLLKKAKRSFDNVREKDLKSHLQNKDEEADIKLEDVQEMISKQKKSNKKEDEPAESKDEMAPIKFDPKEDYQVKEAINYLKSFDVLKKISAGPAAAKISSN